MQKIFKFSTLTVVLFIGLLITGCGTTSNTDETTEIKADSDKAVNDTKAEPDKTAPETVKPETVKPTAKKTLIKPEKEEKLDVEKAYKVFVGSEEELYAKIKYPGYWRLTKIPGRKSIPGVEKLERWCKFRFESLDASIEITVLDGERDLEKLIPSLKERILKRYSLNSFLESPPKLVAIDDAKVDDKDMVGGKLDTIVGEGKEDEEDLPDFDETDTDDQDETQSQPDEAEGDDVEPDDDDDAETDDDDVEPDDDDDDAETDDDDVEPDDDDGLELDDDDDDVEPDDDDGLELDDDDEEETDDDDVEPDDDGLELDDDDDDETDDDDVEPDDDDLELDDDDDETDDDDVEPDDDDEIAEPKDDISKGAKIFKRNEVWLKGKEMWSKTSAYDSTNIKALEYEGRFVYDQKLFLVKVYAVNYKRSNNTYYSIFVCEAENFVRYEKEYTRTVQNVSFPKKESTEED